jgi:hypothetical protein
LGPTEFSNRDSVDCDAKAVTLDRVAPRQPLEYWIIRQPPRVVAIRVPTGKPVNPLGKHLDQLVTDLARLPLIAQAAHQAIEQAQPAVHRLEQYRAAVRAAVMQVEADVETFAEEIREQKTLCRGRIVHAKASCVAESLFGNCFLPRGGFSFVYFRELSRLSPLRLPVPPLRHELDCIVESMSWHLAERCR